MAEPEKREPVSLVLIKFKKKKEEKKYKQIPNNKRAINLVKNLVSVLGLTVFPC